MKILHTYLNISIAFWVIVTIVFGAIALVQSDSYATESTTATEVAATIEPAAATATRYCDSTHCWTQGKWHIEDGCNHTEEQILNGDAEKAPDVFQES